MHDMSAHVCMHGNVGYRRVYAGIGWGEGEGWVWSDAELKTLTP